MADKRAYDGTFYCGFRKVTSKGIIRIDKAIFNMKNSEYFGRTVFCMLDIVKVPNRLEVYLPSKYFSQDNFIERIDGDYSKPINKINVR